MTWLWVVLGAAVGAPLRYLADRALQARYGGLFPWGTLLVNVGGSLAMGGLVGVADGGVTGTHAQASLGTGLCGALTTYSTFGYETLRLAERGRPVMAVANVTLSVLAGLGALAAGNAVARAWSG